MQVAIVGRTVWSDRRCIGVAAIDTGRAYRLLPNTYKPGVHSSWFHDADSPLQIGDVWEIEGTPSRYAKAPHSEDFILSRMSFVRKLDDVKAFIESTCKIVEGPIQNAYDSTLKISRDRLLIPVAGRTPDHSTCFWRTDQPLLRFDEKNKIRFIYNNCTISYVGEQPPGVRCFLLPERSIIRLSLSRQFTTERHPSAYWLQISDWYAAD